jgi:MerR family transcriptional regulator, mercuric resistance operon regulatory protein
MTKSDIEAPPRALGIGALSVRAGVHTETVRYYERIGIMPKPPRTEGGHRIYDADHLKRLTFIRRARGLGFSLEEVRGLLKLVDGGGLTCGEVQGMTLAHAADIRRKIDDLVRMERMLSEMAAQCEGGDVPQCPALDALWSGR